MKQIDYYGLLEVNRRSSKEVIKANYRRLAKVYHPDANIEDPSAEEKFKDLNAAYSTLMDKEKKKKYDRQVAIRHGYGIEPKADTTKKSQEESTDNKEVVNEILSTILGFSKEAREVVKTRTEELKNKMTTKKLPKKGENIEASLDITIEEGFFGADKKLALKTMTGKVSNYSVSVPKGIKDSEKIRLAALGKPGKNGGKPGDLIITVKMKSHSTLTLEGLNLMMPLTISHAQAVIGDAVYVKLFGEQVEVKVPANTKAGDKIVVAKKGYTDANSIRGNLIITFDIAQTTDISERERKIYEQLLRVEKQRIKEKNKNTSKQEMA